MFTPTQRFFTSNIQTEDHEQITIAIKVNVDQVEVYKPIAHRPTEMTILGRFQTSS